jgi:hypothetical protein
MRETSQLADCQGLLLDLEIQPYASLPQMYRDLI